MNINSIQGNYVNNNNVKTQTFKSIKYHKNICANCFIPKLKLKMDGQDLVNNMVDYSTKKINLNNFKTLFKEGSFEADKFQKEIIDKLDKKEAEDLSVILDTYGENDNIQSKIVFPALKEAFVLQDAKNNIYGVPLPSMEEINKALRSIIYDRVIS